MKDLDTKERFVELRAQGMSFAAIALELSVSKATLIGWSKEMQEEINNFRQLHLDSIREKYRLQTESRMEFFSDQLGKLRAELQKRDLSEVRTDRLLDLALKVFREAQSEEQPTVFKERRESGFLDMRDIEGGVRSWQA